MSYDLNQTILFGRLTRDPEIVYTQNNMAICKFSIANNQGDNVNFFNIVAFDKIANTCGQYLKKGKLIIIGGKLKQNTWRDESGKNHSKIEIIANTVQFLNEPTPSGKKQEVGNSEETVSFDDIPDESLSDDEVPW